MSEYEKNLKYLFSLTVNDQVIYSTLSREEKRKFMDFRYSLKNNRSISESKMRKIVEKHLDKQIEINDKK